MKHIYNINNLDCPNCAKKLEDYLNSNNIKVTINFTNKTFNYDGDLSLKELNKIVSDFGGYSLTKEEKELKYNYKFLIIGTIITLLGIYLNINNIIKNILIIIGFIILLYNTSLKAYKLLLKKIIDENLLIVISCIGAYLINKPFEGLMVIVLYTIGKLLEDKAVNKTRRSIKELLSIKKNYCTLNTGKRIKIEDIKVGDILLIKKGEQVLCDSILMDKTSIMDTSSITGESLPLTISKKENILSGYINISDPVKVKVINNYHDSTMSKILNLVEDATNNKAKLETKVSKIGRVYTPIVLILSILAFILLKFVFKLDNNECLYRSICFLVVSCPCAILISVPLSYFTGIGISSYYGILFKGSNYLDNFHRIKNIIFDKTGTLTNGIKIDKIKYYSNYDKNLINNIISSGESLSNHPISKTMINLGKINTKKIDDFKEVDGGIKFKYDDFNIVIGNNKLTNIDNDYINVLINKELVCEIIISDDIKTNVKESINYLNNNNINTYLFTGDKKDKCINLCEKIGIKNYKYELLPDDKYKEFKKIKQNGSITSFVGDGINDSLSIKGADIGISMGNLGSNIAIEASDVVIMNDDISKLITGIKISKYTNRIVLENLIFSLFIKLLILVLSSLGIASMIFCVFADTGLTLLTIINTIRIRLKKY